ncbi:MAG TPA: formylglycine-generating enzyme family protein [bacterium]|jgi:formylglycine-generating enzyme required for sulfatase activity
MRWRSSFLLFPLLLISISAAIADSPDSGTSPKAGEAIPPLVNPNAPAAFDARANMAWIEGRDITWSLPDPAGRKRQKEGPKRTTAGFYMDRTEVSNQEYAQFLSASDSNSVFFDPRMDIVLLARSQYRAKSGRESFPVAWVDWMAAYAFAKWAGKSLPTEDEWMIAALDGRALRTDTTLYVWKDSTQCNRLNVTGFPGRMAAGSFPQGITTSGLSDLAGNVAEWTLSEETSSAQNSKPQTWVVVKGGSFLDTAQNMTVYSRALRDRAERLSSVGFRCILRESHTR